MVNDAVIRFSSTGNPGRAGTGGLRRARFSGLLPVLALLLVAPGLFAPAGQSATSIDATLNAPTESKTTDSSAFGGTLTLSLNFALATEARSAKRHLAAGARGSDSAVSPGGRS